MSQKECRVRQSFLHGALILTVGVLLVKVIGALFKIPLSAVIAEDGMGYFSTAYSLYNVILSLATAGFPVAVSRMVSQNDSLGRYRDVRLIRRVSFPLFLLAGAAGSALMVLGAPLYTNAVGSPGALPAMLALAPCVLLCSLASVYRGYYEGLRNMLPTMGSQVAESLGKLVFGLSGAYFVMERLKDEYAQSGTVLGRAMESSAQAGRAICSLGAAAAILGVTAGSLLSLLYLHRYSRRRSDGLSEAQLESAPEPQRAGKLARRLVAAAVPIAIGAVSMSVSGLIDASFLQTRTAYILRSDPEPMLQMYAGCIPQETLGAPETIPNYLFGCYNMALTLFMLIPSVTQAFGISALPSVTHAFARGVKKELQGAMETVLRVTCIFALPAGVGLTVLAEPITELIYGQRMSAPIIAKALAVMGIAAIFAAVTTPLASMLQAVGRMELSVILVMGGLCVKVVLNYFLAGIPEINILGGGLSTLVSYVLVTIAELTALVHVTGIRLNLVSTALKPLAAAMLCGAGARFTVRICAPFAARFAAIPAVFAGTIVYFVALLLLRGIAGADIAMLPGGEKIIKRLEKYLQKSGG